MCGIAGIVRPAVPLDPIEVDRVALMADCLRHRGPDGYGMYHDDHAVLAARRLAIIDIESGHQPVRNEDGTVHAVFNGEIFNHRSLRTRLESRGHCLRSRCDTEVLVHLYEDHGLELVNELVGQFAFAIWDARARRLVLARDRMGICPLCFHVTDLGLIAFASEAKAILGAGLLEAEIDEVGLAQAAHFGCAVAPRTMFRGVRALCPGQLLFVDGAGARSRTYWDIEFPARGPKPAGGFERSAQELRGRLQQAVARTLMSDVPVGTFLSGGIDSGVVTALANRCSGAPLPAFTIGSPHRIFDERSGAGRTSAWTGSPLTSIIADDRLIACEFEAFVWHAEAPVLSTEAPALMALAAEAGKQVKVVLTGEGSDEGFAGYRMFLHHRWLGPLTNRGVGMLRALGRPALRAFFAWNDFLLPRENRLDTIRDAAGCVPAQAQEYEFYRTLVPLVFRDEVASEVLDTPVWHELGLPTTQIGRLHPLDQSLYIGYKVMLPNYLLGPHGDRALMAHSVEGRYPFLDRDVVEFAAQVPPEWKLRGMREKRVLRTAARGWLPREIVSAPKRRFMASFGLPFLGADAPATIRELMQPDALKAYGYFDPKKVAQVAQALCEICASGRRASRSTRAKVARLGYAIAITLVASVQLFHHQFLEGAGFRRARRREAAPLTTCVGSR
jgi:asparagine synthase (glutamine-hydrolysing)